MNKKILKLALDAGVLNYVDLETPRRYFVSAHANEEDVEEFAKLIVRECIEISQVGSITETKLKQHFGIEE